MKNECRTWTMVAALAALVGCGDKAGQVNYLENAPVVATRVLIDGEEMIELDPSLHRSFQGGCFGAAYVRRLPRFLRGRGLRPVDAIDER